MEPAEISAIRVALEERHRQLEQQYRAAHEEIRIRRRLFRLQRGMETGAIFKDMEERNAIAAARKDAHETLEIAEQFLIAEKQKLDAELVLNEAPGVAVNFTVGRASFQRIIPAVVQGTAIHVEYVEKERRIEAEKGRERARKRLK
jgi:hypothetical protein